VQKHKHHIIPKSLGGSNNELNIVLLTISGHAAVHKWMYEEYGRWEDWLAYRVLNGQIIGKSDNELKNPSIHPRKGIKHTAESIKKMKENRKGKCIGKNNGMFGKTHTEKAKEKIRESRKRSKHPRGMLGKTHSNETKIKISESCKGIKKPRKCA